MRNFENYNVRAGFGGGWVLVGVKEHFISELMTLSRPLMTWLVNKSYFQS